MHGAALSVAAVAVRSAALSSAASVRRSDAATRAALGFALPPAPYRGVVLRASSSTRSIEGTVMADETSPPEGASEAAPDDVTRILRRRKQSFRKRIRSRMRESYPPGEVASAKLAAESSKVFSRLFALPEYRAASSVGFFLSMPSGEIQTRDAMGRMVRDGKDIYVPRVGLDFEKCDMDLIRCDAASVGDGTMFYDDWPRNKWGIPEPPLEHGAERVARPGDIDLLVVPGLGFDAHGHRLGQGKGYYDRFISRMRGANGGREESDSSEKPLLVGVCLEEQFLDEMPHGIDLEGTVDDGRGHIIPVSDHDYVMDAVLSPSMTLIVKQNQSS